MPDATNPETPALDRVVLLAGDGSMAELSSLKRSLAELREENGRLREDAAMDRSRYEQRMREKATAECSSDYVPPGAWVRLEALDGAEARIAEMALRSSALEAALRSILDAGCTPNAVYATGESPWEAARSLLARKGGGE